MKISVLIIAHNEEKHIAQCIKSILDQTKKPDEIVLVVHNSTDRTFEIAKRYPITVISFSGSKGIVYARIKGLESVTGDYILCIDGDSFAEKNWVEVMVKTLLRNNNILVGSWVKFKGTIFGIAANWFNKYLCVSKGKKATTWLWGPSFAFRAEYKDEVRKIFEKSMSLSGQLNLSRNPDDYWLALFMEKRGSIEVTNNTYVTQYTKETSTKNAFIRNRENIRNGKLIRLYLSKQS